MTEWVDAPWGRHRVLYEMPGVTVKVLEVSAGEGLSVQVHRERAESWLVVSGVCRAAAWQGGLDEPHRVGVLGEGRRFWVPKGWTHLLEAIEDTVVLEVCRGRYDPDDIVRLSDRYGREA
jgi:mannose-6-phosphate isomerase-like protein (cupin superfamily)